MTTIRCADVRDMSAAAQIINGCAEHGQMLHRSMSFLYEHVRDFFVAEDDGKIVGVCGLVVVWADLAEVYALAVDSSQRGKGIGRSLVESCIDQARQLHIGRLMSLTYEQAFFERCGFGVIDRQQLPLKVWSECLRCAKNQACDEIAMMYTMEDIPLVSEPARSTLSEDAYVVPVTVTIGKTRGPQQKMDEAY
jgi:amino-acid N-acetyltransferase